MKLLQIENRVAKVRLNDAVTPWSADDLIGDIERSYGKKAVAENLTVGGFQAKADDALETLEIEINSPGGSVLDGYRVYNALMQMRGRGVRVIATVNTLAASMGSVILMAADEVKIVEGGRIMIHEAAQTVSGNSADHARAAKNLDEISDEIAGIYAKKTGGKPQEMRDLMKAETWMGAKESVERGFADSILKFDTKPKAMSILAKLFPGNAEAAQLEAEIAENSTLRADLIEAQAKITELQGLSAVIAEKDQEIQAKITELSEVKAQIADFTAKLEEKDAEIADLTEKATATAEKISIEASRQLAAQGHPAAVAVENSNQEAKPETKYDQYRKLQSSDPVAASAFWDTNEKDIIAGK
jgi:ATP-dependent protease ClpP protease subunit